MAKSSSLFDSGTAMPLDSSSKRVLCQFGFEVPWAFLGLGIWVSGLAVEFCGSARFVRGRFAFLQSGTSFRLTVYDHTT